MFASQLPIFPLLEIPGSEGARPGAVTIILQKMEVQTRWGMEQSKVTQLAGDRARIGTQTFGFYSAH